MNEPGQKPQPRRLQLSRKKGYRKPVGAVVVSRPNRWGNPFKIGDTSPAGQWIEDAAEAVRLYREANSHPDAHRRIRMAFRGKDLACWCKPGEPCHADVLLEIANA